MIKCSFFKNQDIAFFFNQEFVDFIFNHRNNQINHNEQFYGSFKNKKKRENKFLAMLRLKFKKLFVYNKLVSKLS